MITECQGHYTWCEHENTMVKKIHKTPRPHGPYILVKKKGQISKRYRIIKWRLSAMEKIKAEMMSW